MPRPDREQLPEWADGTVAILSTVGEGPHAIPVSTGFRVHDRLILLALASRRRSLAYLRAEPRVALTLLCEGDVAVTAHGRAEVIADPMAQSDRVCAVAVTIDRIQDHGQPRFVIEAGPRWRWTDPDARSRDVEVREGLKALARVLAG